MQPSGPSASFRRLWKLFTSYRGTENERPIRHEQATLLSGMTFFFAILGTASCMLFTFAFGRKPVLLARQFLLPLANAVAFRFCRAQFFM